MTRWALLDRDDDFRPVREADGKLRIVEGEFAAAWEKANGKPYVADDESVRYRLLPEDYFAL